MNKTPEQIADELMVKAGFSASPKAKDGARSRVDSAHTTKQPLHDWDAPDWSILDDRRGELSEFPLECLPEPVRAWVQRAADGAGVTVAHVAVPALGIASSLVGMARRVQASRSWIAPMTCWTAVVGASGTGKTPGIETIKRALDQVERNNRSKIADLRRKHEESAGVAKAARAQWDKEVKDALAAKKAPPPMPQGAMDLGKFVAPQIYISNATVERLGELLQARPQGMLLLMDELAALFTNMSRYSGGQDNEFWLEAWNGGSCTVERMSRSLCINHLLVGVVGGVQPDKLARSFEGDQDGMYARFLFSWPPTSDYQPLTDEADEFDPDIINAITRLDRLAEFEDGNLVKRSIELSAEARAQFEELRKWAHREREALDGREQEWMAKASAHALRLAGALCLLEWAWGQSTSPPATIASDYMTAAIKLVRSYFWPHARAALRQVGLSERHVNARRVLRWIRAHRDPGQEISIEDIRRDALGRSLDADGSIDLLGAMTRSGWMREKDRAKSSPQGGRPPRRWETNPKLWLAEIPETPETSPNTPSAEVSGISGVSGSHIEVALEPNEGGTPADDGGTGDDDGLPEFLRRTPAQEVHNGNAEKTHLPTSRPKAAPAVRPVAPHGPKASPSPRLPETPETPETQPRADGAAGGAGRASPAQRNTAKTHLFSADPVDIPIVLRRCAQCGKPGAESWDLNGRSVHLHPGCQHAWADNQERAAPATERKATKGTNKTNGKPTKAWLVPALDEADSDALARWYAGMALEDDGDEVRAGARLRAALVEMVPPEAVEREYDRVMQAIDRLAGDDPRPHDGARLQ